MIILTLWYFFRMVVSASCLVLVMIGPFPSLMFDHGEGGVGGSVLVQRNLQVIPKHSQKRYLHSLECGRLDYLFATKTATVSVSAATSGRCLRLIYTYLFFRLQCNAFASFLSKYPPFHVHELARGPVIVPATHGQSGAS